MVVDGHVHIHPCFDLRVVLDAALQNFQRLGCSDAAFLLALTESCSQDVFGEMRRQVVGADSALSRNVADLGEWQITLTEEPDSLKATRERAALGDRALPSETLYVVAGRQIASSEGLEVLALATDQPFEDFQSMEETIQAVVDRGGVPVVPWGVGKWMGRRGRRLSALLGAPLPKLFLADNSSRPSFWPEPPLFRVARSRGLFVLSGTDPLPLKSEANRAGLAGFQLVGTFDSDCPAASLRRALLTVGEAAEAGTSVDGTFRLPQIYGALERPVRAVRNQLAMQFIKRFGRWV